MPPSFPSSSASPGSEGIGPRDYTAALASLAHRRRATGVLAIEGPDRIDFLQGQVTQDVKSLAPGRVLPAAGLTPKGKLIYFGRVLAEAERLFLLLPAAAVPAVAAHLTKYAVFQKVAVRDVTDAHAEIGVYGPGAAGLELPKEAVRLPPEGEFAGGLLVPAGLLAGAAAILDRAGSITVSPGTAEILRVEAGRPLLGRDADATNLPQEVGLSAAISYTKGCYVGQEIVARVRTYGRINRRLVGFRFPGEPAPEGAVFPDPAKPDHELARVTSAVASPRFGAIGLGLAFREVAEGSAVRDPDRPERVAIVSRLPFA